MPRIKYGICHLCNHPIEECVCGPIYTPKLENSRRMKKKYKQKDDE